MTLDWGGRQNSSPIKIQSVPLYQGASDLKIASASPTRPGSPMNGWIDSPLWQTLSRAYPVLKTLLLLSFIATVCLSVKHTLLVFLKVGPEPQFEDPCAFREFPGFLRPTSLCFSLASLPGSEGLSQCISAAQVCRCEAPLLTFFSQERQPQPVFRST